MGGSYGLFLGGDFASRTSPAGRKTKEIEEVREALKKAVDLDVPMKTCKENCERIGQIWSQYQEKSLPFRERQKTVGLKVQSTGFATQLSVDWVDEGLPSTFRATKNARSTTVAAKSFLSRVL